MERPVETAERICTVKACQQEKGLAAVSGKQDSGTDTADDSYHQLYQIVNKLNHGAAPRPFWKLLRSEDYNRKWSGKCRE